MVLFWHRQRCFANGVTHRWCVSLNFCFWRVANRRRTRLQPCRKRLRINTALAAGVRTSGAKAPVCGSRIGMAEQAAEKLNEDVIPKPGDVCRADGPALFS